MERKNVVFIFHEQDSSSTLTASLPAFETDGRAAGCSKGGKEIRTKCPYVDGQ
jgi:hypothetical protein